jgi:hypothetical protein
VNDAPPRPTSRWRKLAQLGFWFFLLKGLLWILVPAAIAYFGWRS